MVEPTYACSMSFMYILTNATRILSLCERKYKLVSDIGDLLD